MSLFESNASASSVPDVRARIGAASLSSLPLGIAAIATAESRSLLPDAFESILGARSATGASQRPVSSGRTRGHS